MRILFLHFTKIQINKTIEKIKLKDIQNCYYTYFMKKKIFRKFFYLPYNIEIILTDYALKNQSMAKLIIKKYIKKHPNKYSLQLLYAQICYLNNDIIIFEQIINNIKIPFLAPYSIKLYYKHLLSQSYLYNTDMKEATFCFNNLLKAYKKLGYYYEEGLCYLSLAQIYKIIGMFDVSFNMLNQANMIFSKINLPIEIAKINANKGLIELVRNNYKQTFEYLSSAENICIQNNLLQTLCDIKNWQGLTYFAENKLTYALKCLKQNLKSKFATNINKAFAADLISRIYYQKDDNKNCLKYIEESMKYNFIVKDNAGIFENKYLKAKIYYNLKEYENSKKILIGLIKKKKSNSIYYPANAYTLLGLIHLKQKDLAQAKTLFKQAVDLENSTNRLKGAILDYNNLFLIAK